MYKVAPLGFSCYDYYYDDGDDSDFLCLANSVVFIYVYVHETLSVLNYKNVDDDDGLVFYMFCLLKVAILNVAW